jgi:uncharacterized membrane protein YkoI
MTRLKFGASLVVLAGLAAAPAFATSETDIQGVESAKVSLSDAISSAQKVCGGKATKAMYETSHGAGNYEVACVANGQFERLYVNPQTGAATKEKQASASSSDTSDMQTIENAKIGLSDAISTAEGSGGKALGVTLSSTNGQQAYKVTVANGTQTNDVWIDATSGTVLKSKS